METRSRDEEIAKSAPGNFQERFEPILGCAELVTADC